MSYQNGPRIVTNGLVLCLDAGNSKSYPGSGTSWTDLSGNGNNGTLTNGPTFSSNNKGYIIYDGTDDNVNIPHNTNIDIRSQITMEAWVYLNTYSAGGTNTDRSTITIKAYSYYMSVTKSSGKLASYFYGLDTVHRESNSQVPLTTWVHTVITFNGSSINWYLQSILDKTYSISGSIVPALDGSLGIGYETQSNFGRALNGRISMARLYSRALTASEIVQNYNATKGRFGL